MRILILADGRQKEGGNNEIIKHMISALDDHKSTYQIHSQRRIFA